MLIIKNIIKETKMWPSRAAYEVVACAGNSEFVATMPKAKVDLCNFIMNAVGSGDISTEIADELWSRIQTFGEEKYEEGDFDGSYTIE